MEPNDSLPCLQTPAIAPKKSEQAIEVLRLEYWNPRSRQNYFRESVMFN
jgi:hypothetical protein